MGKKGFEGVRIFNIVALGGMGKSALTWKWFNEIAPQVQPYPAYMAGRMWWSFYENDGYFENFIIQALAYVGRINLDEAKKIPASEREDKLWSILDREPHLLVLDGLERLLIAYARLDAAHIADDNYDEWTANYISNARDFSASESEKVIDGHRLRKTVNPRVGKFLKRLTQIRASWILVSTRLYPFDLQGITGNPLPGCFAYSLEGLSNKDVLALWREYGVSGTDDVLLPMFKSFDCHPLLLQVLAGSIARNRKAPGDFNSWYRDNPNFDPFTLPLIQAKNHVMEFALKELSVTERQVLQTVAVLRMPTNYDRLRSLFVKRKEKHLFWKILFRKPPNYIFQDEHKLASNLENLEDRGLLGWNRKNNRYDLHPLVRGVVKALAKENDLHLAFIRIKNHFTDEGKIWDWHKVQSLEDLTPAIELFYSHIGLRKYFPAFIIFMQWLDDATLYGIGYYRHRVQMLEDIWLNSNDLILEHKLFKSRLIKIQRLMWNPMALSYKYNGQPNKAINIYKEHLPQEEINGDYQSFIAGLFNLSDALIDIGKLKNANDELLRITNHSSLEKGSCDYYLVILLLGHNFAIIGNIKRAEYYFSQYFEQDKVSDDCRPECFGFALYSLFLTRINKLEKALQNATQSWHLAQINGSLKHIISAACRHGQVSLALGDYATASERLHYALTRARDINLVEEELQALITLAEFSRQQYDPTKAREHLDDVWEYAERGPYPLFHADARNVLCQIERDAGNIEAAIEAATQAYRLAWCDGPPYAYHYGLENAKKHLRELGAPEPEMPKNREELT